VQRLNQLLLRLRDAGNTVLVVEHHPQVIRIADHVIDMGPGAGSQGGLVQFQGTPKALLGSDTVTGRLLSTPLRLTRVVRERRACVQVENASAHNLAGFDVNIPIGVLTTVTGVAGSGKSSLATNELPCQHPECTVVGQDPLRGEQLEAESPPTDIPVLGELENPWLTQVLAGQAASAGEIDAELLPVWSPRFRAVP
jgi:excinuclease UvrABC ATPase subunit